MPQQRSPRQRSTLSTYAPLLITLTVATAGALVWIWSDRRNSDDDEDRYEGSIGRPSSSTVTGPPPYREGEETFLSRASATGNSALTSARGWIGAAGSALGIGGSDDTQRPSGSRRAGESAKAAGKRRMGDSGRPAREDGFSDHERWTEQAVLLKEKDIKAAAAASTTTTTAPVRVSSDPKPIAAQQVTGKDTKKKRSVAVVLTAEERHLHNDLGGDEHTSLLSHIPSSNLSGAVTVYVLIYLPTPLTSLPETSPLIAQAKTLVGDNATQILPFSTPTGYVHMLRHLAPNMVYLQDTPELSGPGGTNVAQLKGWVGQTVLVVGEDGSGGLADTETEGEELAAGDKARTKWYETSDLVGLGKGLEVVDVMRLGDDWVRRTQ